MEPTINHRDWEDFEKLSLELEYIIRNTGGYFPSRGRLEELGRGDLIDAVENQHGGFDAVAERLCFNRRDPWENMGNVRRQIEEIQSGLGRFPTYKEVRFFGPKGFLDSLKKNHGGFPKVKTKLGISQEPRRSKKDWVGFEDLESELARLTKLMGGFPSQEDLQKMGRTDLLGSIYESHGGFDVVRERMFPTRNKRPNGFWEDPKRVDEELKVIIDQIGHFPTHPELEKLKRNDLVYGIQTYHGGLKKVRERMGYGSPVIKTNEQFLSHLREDQNALKLSYLSNVLNGEALDVERIILELYGDKFQDHKSLHKFLQDNQIQINNLIEEGITNLGTYLGNYSLGDRNIVPLLIGEIVGILPEERVSRTVEDGLVRILRNTYSPRFNSDPKITIQDLTRKREDSNGKMRNLYSRLLSHYEETIELGGKL